ncbi:MAG: hypothetical protein ABSC50_01600 [Candidatus Bathyarchaeia archaeon]
MSLRSLAKSSSLRRFLARNSRITAGLNFLRSLGIERKYRTLAIGFLERGVPAFTMAAKDAFKPFTEAKVK